MDVMSEKLTGQISVEVSPDRMEAWVKISAGVGDRPPGAEEHAEALEDLTAPPKDVKDALEEAAAALEETTAPPEEVKDALEEATAALEEVIAPSEEVKDELEEATAALEQVVGVPSGDKSALEEVVDALKDEGIVINDYVDERIEALGAILGEGTEGVERFLIAKGQLPVEGEDGEFTWHESLERIKQDWLADDPIDYYTLNSIVTAEEDKPIGTITPPTPGVDGFDVRGKPLKPEGTPREVQLDQSVRLADDGSMTVFSNVAGKVNYTDLKLAIDEVVTISGDVDFKSGNIDATVNVNVQGSIRDLFSVESAKSIMVGGTIAAANVKAKGDVTVGGGILGRAKGAVEAEGEIVAKFCTDADLCAKGDIKMTCEVMNSRLRSESKLLVGQGPIIGGKVYAREGVEAFNLGSEANVPTSIAVGIDPQVVRQAAAIDEKLEKMRETGAHLHETVKPLLAELKRLTPTQKQQAMELLLKVRALVTKIQETETGRDELLQAGRAVGVPYVLATGIIYKGVRIRIGRRNTVFRDDMKGPVKIEKQKVDKVTEFVAVNELNQSVTVLASSKVVEEEPEPEPTPVQESKS